MDLKVKSITEITFRKEDLINLIREKYSLGENIKVSVQEVTETEVVSGYDPHDADYIQRFAGVKFHWEE